MLLKIKDRLIVLGLLPLEGTLSQMVDIYDLARELKLSDLEKEEVCYNENGLSITWDYNKDPNKDITFSKDLMSIFMNVIDKLDKQEKISLNQIETILKIKNG